MRETHVDLLHLSPNFSNIVLLRRGGLDRSQLFLDGDKAVKVGSDLNLACGSKEYNL